MSRQEGLFLACGELVGGLYHLNFSSMSMTAVITLPIVVLPTAMPRGQLQCILLITKCSGQIRQAVQFSCRIAQRHDSLLPWQYWTRDIYGPLAERMLRPFASTIISGTGYTKHDSSMQVAHMCCGDPHKQIFFFLRIIFGICALFDSQSREKQERWSRERGWHVANGLSSD